MSGVPIIEPVGDFEFAKMTDNQKKIKRMEEQASQTFISGVRQFIQLSELNNLKKMSNKADDEEIKKIRKQTADNVNKMTLVQLSNFILDWGKVPEGKKSIYKNLVYKGSIDGILKYKFDLAKDLFLRRRLKYRRLLTIGGGLVIAGGTVTGSAIGISTIVQHSKNSKRTETRNGIVDK